MLHSKTKHFKSYFSTAFLFVVFSSMSACNKEKVDKALIESEDKEYLVHANEATDLLAKRLGGQLKAALESGGPEAGIEICQQIGQSLTQSTNNELDGMTVTRTSLKIRNPLNAPSPKDKEIMMQWQKQLEKNGKLPESEVVHQEDQSPVVYKPIITQKVCMKCHGNPSTFSPELTSLIKKHYPDDQATGFTEGSIRGAFKVIFPKR